MSEVAGATGKKHVLQVGPRLVRSFWDRNLVKPGQKAKLHVQTVFVPDGTSVEIELFAQTSSKSIKPKGATISGTVDKGVAELEWTAELDGLTEGELAPIVLVGMRVQIGVLPLPVMGLNLIAVASYGAVLKKIDKSFCPGSEELEISYSILDPFKFVRSGIVRVFGNQVEGKNYPDEAAIVYQRMLSPDEITTGTHTVRWSGFTNAESGPFKPASDDEVRYVNPMHSPYVVDVQLLDRVVTGADSWPQDDALLSIPHPSQFDGVGLTDVGDAAQTTPEHEAPKHAAFEIVVAGMEFKLGSYVPDEGEMPSGAEAAAQYRLNELGYFCGPVDGKVGKLSKRGIHQFKRNRWEVVENPDDASDVSPDKTKPLGDPDTAKVDSSLDDATKKAIAAEDAPRTWMEILDEHGNVATDDEGRLQINRLPRAGEQARIVLDGTAPYQKSTEFWNSAAGKADITKQEREDDWIPRPFIPVEAQPVLLDRKGQRAKGEDSRFGTLGMRVLWRVADPEESHAGLGFHEGDFTTLTYTEHEVASVVIPGLDTNEGVQLRLQRLGYEVGNTIDGVLDADFKDGIRTFQGDQGLTADGNITAETRAKVGEVHGTGTAETMDDIARKYGYDDPQKILDDPINKQFSDDNPDPANLTVGDKVQIPPFTNFAKYKVHKEGKPESFVQATVGSYAGTAVGDWLADNAPDKDGNKKIFGERTKDESTRGTDYLRHADKLFKLAPFEPEQVDDPVAGSGKVMSTKVVETGAKRGRTGTFFVPSNIAGDNYRIEAWADVSTDGAGGDHPNKAWLDERYPNGAPIGASGTMTNWRRIAFAEFQFIRDRRIEADKIMQADWARMRALYRHAYVDLELPPEPDGLSMSQDTYRSIVAAAYNCDKESVDLDRDQFFPALSSGLSAAERGNHPLALPAQNAGEDPGAYVARLDSRVSDFHEQFAKQAGLQMRNRHRTAPIIVDFRRNLKAVPINRTDGTAIPMARLTAFFEGKFLSTGQAKGVLLMDQRDPDVVPYVWGHELGHSLFLYHWKNTGENNTRDHDNDDDYCVMMYSGDMEATKIDPDFCGKCLLKLRGWNEQVLPATAPSGSGPSSAKKNADEIAAGKNWQAPAEAEDLGFDLTGRYEEKDGYFTFNVNQAGKRVDGYICEALMSGSKRDERFGHLYGMHTGGRSFEIKEVGGDGKVLGSFSGSSDGSGATLELSGATIELVLNATVPTKSEAAVIAMAQQSTLLAKQEFMPLTRDEVKWLRDRLNAEILGPAISKFFERGLAGSRIGDAHHRAEVMRQLDDHLGEVFSTEGDKGWHPGDIALARMRGRDLLASTFYNHEDTKRSLLDWLYVLYMRVNLREWQGSWGDYVNFENHLGFKRPMNGASSVPDTQHEYEATLKTVGFSFDVLVGLGVFIVDFEVRKTTEPKWTHVFNGWIANVSGGASVGVSVGAISPGSATSADHWESTEMHGWINMISAGAAASPVVGPGASETMLIVRGTGVHPPIAFDMSGLSLEFGPQLGAEVGTAFGYIGSVFDDKSEQDVSRLDVSKQFDSTWGTKAQVHFATDEAHLTPEARDAVRILVASELASFASRSSKLVIRGYTDRSADPDYNLELSEWRAKNTLQAIKDIAGSRFAIAKENIEIEAHGEEPAKKAGAKDGAHLKAWRKVEVVLDGRMVMVLRGA